MGVLDRCACCARPDPNGHCGRHDCRGHRVNPRPVIHRRVNRRHCGRRFHPDPNRHLAQNHRHDRSCHFVRSCHLLQSHRPLQSHHGPGLRAVRCGRLTMTGSNAAQTWLTRLPRP